MAWFNCAVHRPITFNTGGLKSGQLGYLMHQQVGLGSLFAYFDNPAAQVSAHFWVSQSGLIEQYVDTGVVAWHAMNLNALYCGTEFEGFPDEPLTPQQINAGGAILAEGNRRHGWAFQLCNELGMNGLGYHRMPGFQSSTACPSDLRLSARLPIISAASGILTPPTPTPTPPPSPKGHEMIRATATGKGYWIVFPNGAVYTYGDAPFHGGANGTAPPPSPLPDPYLAQMVPGDTVTGIDRTPTDDGYWLTTQKGYVYAFGDALYLGGAENEPQ